jgi:hypothetical protein
MCLTDLDFLSDIAIDNKFFIFPYSSSVFEDFKVDEP